ncbi:MAG: adenosine kinase [Fibrobacteraceae bacterium]|nr:adenosine kinase [Fibrobacteraceae bacterium]
MKKVLGIGAALVDMLVSVDDLWIKNSGGAKGGMNSVDFPKLKNLVTGLLPPQIVPGGSACNTMVGIARLGGKASFLSKVGRDSLGEVFEKHLRDMHVESCLLKSSTATGTVLSAVTPDAERTMFTFLGASNELSSADVTLELFDNVGILYMEGYRAYDEKCFVKAIETARKLNVMTALDFGSFGVVNDCRPLFNKLFAGKSVDLVIANEDEAKAYTGLSEEAALEKLSRFCKIAVVKLGKRGALISKDGLVTKVDAGSAKAIDTTGAGDLWASGFLFGLMSGWNMARAGKLGSIVSNEVVQVMGSKIPDARWEKIKAEMQNV